MSLQLKQLKFNATPHNKVFQLYFCEHFYSEGMKVWKILTVLKILSIFFYILNI